MKYFVTTSLALFFYLFSYSAIIYVDIDATGNNDGTTWQDAFNDLSDAIAISNFGDEIWVAEGIYKPNTTDLYDYYSLKNGTQVYGGFDGTETLRQDRDYELQETILDGNINDPSSYEDNLIHVVAAFSVTNTTRLDGFTIMNGYAGGTISTSEVGGGFVNSGGSCTVANCKFIANRASQGGAVANYEGGIFNLENCYITGSYASFGGGFFQRGFSTTNVINCNISGNQCGSGGGLMVYEGTLNVDRCIISGNTANSSSGAISVHDDGILNLTNSLIVGNIADRYSVIRIPTTTNNNYHTIINCTIAHNRNLDPSQPPLSYYCMFLNNRTEVRNSIIWDNGGFSDFEFYCNSNDISHNIVKNGHSISGVPVPNNYTTEPDFVSPATLNQAPFVIDGYDYSIQPLGFGIDIGVNGYVGNSQYDIDGNPRIQGTSVDVGAYENQACEAADVGITVDGNINLCPGENITLSASGEGQYMWSNGATTADIIVQSAGTYTLNVIDSEGCVGTATQVITEANVSLEIMGELFLCEGDFTTLQAIGDNTNYVWNNGQTGSEIFATEAGTYSVSGISNEGSCNVSAEVDIQMITNPNPPIIYVDESYLNTGNFESYQWYLNGNPIAGATNKEYFPSELGNYTVEVTDEYGCMGFSEQVVVDVISDIQNVYSLGIKIYPTVVSNSIIIDFPESIISTIYIYDNVGKLVKYKMNNDKLSTLDISNLSSGTYYLLIDTDAGAVSEVIFKM